MKQKTHRKAVQKRDQYRKKGSRCSTSFPQRPVQCFPDSFNVKTPSPFSTFHFDCFHDQLVVNSLVVLSSPSLRRSNPTCAIPEQRNSLPFRFLFAVAKKNTRAFSSPGSPCRARYLRSRYPPYRSRSGRTARPDTFAACARSSADTRRANRTSPLSDPERICLAPGRWRWSRVDYHRAATLDDFDHRTTPTSCFDCPVKLQSSVQHPLAVRSVGN